MRKLLTLAMLCASALAANAQTEKGKIILGGTIGYSNSKYESSTNNQKQSNLVLLPSAGYFVKENLALGLGIGYSKNKSNYSAYDSFQYRSDREDKTDYLMVSPFVRQYINITDRFKFFGQLSVPMKWGNTEITIANGNPFVDAIPAAKAKTTSIGVGIEPGLAYFPTKKIGIQLSVDGLSYVWNKTGDNKQNAFNLGTNFLAPRIGIQFYF